MGKGKNLTLVGGILTVIATYALCWFKRNILYLAHYFNGIGAIENILDLFFHPELYAEYYELPTWTVYVIAVLVILFLISGALQILAIKKRSAGIIGSIMPIIISIMIILGVMFNLLPDLIKFLEIFGDSSPLIAGAIPFNYAILGRPESIGSYVLLAGGILGIIGSYMSREEFY